MKDFRSIALVSRLESNIMPKSSRAILWCPEANSAFLNQDNNGPFLDLEGTQKPQTSNCQAVWKRDLYAIDLPFQMDSQAERIHRESATREEGKSDLKMTSAQRKRKKKELRRKNLPQDEAETVALINRTLKTVIEQARKLGLVREATFAPEVMDNNERARVAANAPGCGNLFHEAVEEERTPGPSHHLTLVLNSELIPALSVWDVVDRPVRNASDQTVVTEIEGHKFAIPPRSAFLTSSFRQFVTHGYSQLTVQKGFDLVVIDPPWKNKSVKRKKSYHTLTETDLMAIPMSRLCGPRAVVCVWVTNNARLVDFVKEQLLPAWSVKYLATWLWFKVTRSGEPICDLYSQHKKPYEQIIIGRFEKKLEIDPCSFICINELLKTNSFIPPPLPDALQPFLPAKPRCLELFARNLNPDWTSWGNEVSLH
ncbi:hypothetical protein EGW08_008431, partial [Elysia chlorotica]